MQTEWISLQMSKKIWESTNKPKNQIQAALFYKKRLFIFKLAHIFPK